jgi:hypothetical protein
MLPLKELSPSSQMPQHDLLQELEFKNLQLQKLIVELLDKNERLRRALEQFENAPQA